MKLYYNGNLSELKESFIKYNQEHDYKNDKYILVFKEPTTLHTSRYLKDDKTNTVHEIKKISFSWEKDGNLGYNVGKMRSSCYLFNPHNLDYIEIVSQVAKDYGSQWQAIADSMKRYGINPDVVKSIEDHLTGKTEHIEGFQNYWKRTDKPRTMSFADVLQRVVGYAQNIELNKPYPHKEYMRLQREWINGRAIEQMKNKMTTRKIGENDYTGHSERIYGKKRDRSVEMWLGINGQVKYAAASEYSGCGNGDYYTMYSPTMAFYAETD